MTHLTDVVQGDELGGKATMNTKEATVDEGSDGERIEGIQACVVDGLRVLVEACGKKEDGRHIEFGDPGPLGEEMRTFTLESKIFCQMSTLVVATKESDIFGALDLERVEV